MPRFFALRQTLLLALVCLCAAAGMGHTRATATHVERPQTVSATVASARTVDPMDRAASLAFYRSVYRMAPDPSIAWTGSPTACTPGTTSAEFQAAVVQRINYFRAMAGVPAGIVLDDALNRKAQAAALMMSVNKKLHHTPPATWTCYSGDGAEGARKSNLSTLIGWEAIDQYMRDAGPNNDVLGHRRWLLYPQTRRMGTGNVPAVAGYDQASALLVIESETTATTRPAVREAEGFVAWPPRGYVPHTVVYARWSFSYPNADFSAASVTMTRDSGALVPLTRERQVVNGFGENTLAWRPYDRDSFASWPQPAADETYTVSIENVLIDGTPRSFTYQVTVIDAEEQSITPAAHWIHLPLMLR